MRVWVSASLMVAVLATLALDAYVRGGSLAAVVGAVPWVGVALALLVAGATIAPLQQSRARKCLLCSSTWPRIAPPVAIAQAH